jgi:hypothetical protein
MATATGGTGVPPVVSGVTPETVAGWTTVFHFFFPQQLKSRDRIRRDAGFHGRDARATQFQR